MTTKSKRVFQEILRSVVMYFGQEIKYYAYMETSNFAQGRGTE